MLVMVRYNDNNYDIVEEYRLEYLILTGKVIEFARKDRWVTVGADPTREDGLKKSSADVHVYSGPDRRKAYLKASIPSIRHR